MNSKLVEKMRAVRAELIQRDRDEVIKRFAEHVYRNVEPNVRERECKAVFTRRSEMQSLFDGTNKAAREWLFDQLKAEQLIEPMGEYSECVWLTDKGAQRLC